MDLFCGTGYGTAILSKALEWCTWGLDGSSEAIAYANQHFGASNSLFTAKVFPFNLPTEVADCIICFESIEHVEDYRGFFGVLYNALRPGGLMYISAPNELRMPFEKARFPFHYRHFTATEFRALAGAEGARIEKFWSQDVYKMKSDSVQVSPLVPLETFELREGEEGQWLLAKIRRSE
jgi:2-polyprenyl-3-methyl-5-hydroxy-6-metoxy-1,4-benzoquinol methylase